MKNGKYLDSLSSDKKSKILKNIATHYGLSVTDAEDEVRDDDAEMLYEYIVNDNSLRMEVYNDMEKGKYAKGGNMADVRLKYAKKDINLLIKNGMMSIYDTKYGILNLSYEDGKFVIKNNKYNPAKEDYETIFKGDKNDAIKFVANSYQVDEMAKGGKTKVVENNDWQIKEKKVERVRLLLPKYEPKNEFHKYIQKGIIQSIYTLAFDGVFDGVKDSHLDIVVMSLFNDFRRIGEDGVYYGTHKIEEYAREVQKERNTSFEKGGMLGGFTYSIGGM